MIFTLTLIQRLLFGKAEVGLMATDVAVGSTTNGADRSIPRARVRRAGSNACSSTCSCSRSALLFFTPFFWTVATSLKTLPETVGLRPPARHIRACAPTARSLTEFNFAALYRSTPPSSRRRSPLSNVVLCSLGGYAFARLRFPGREVLFLVVLATLMIPDQLRLVPVFHDAHELASRRHRTRATSPIKLVAATNLFLMRQYFLTIPKDFEEAAKLDGAGYFKTYWRVMLPLASRRSRP